jgi:RNA polymerase sporulation-specific sigma factor
VEKQQAQQSKGYAEMSDEAVVVCAKNGDNAALEHIISRYSNFVKSRSRAYFLIGADKEDIVQEGMIGLFKSVRDFNEDKLVAFRAFAELCVTRQIISAIKMATRQKHIPLNSYVSLNKPVYDEESERTLLDIITGVKILNPEDLFISQENHALIEEHIEEILSDLEKQVLELYLQGLSYQEIAVLIDRHVKSIDNALQRIKRKMEAFLKSQNINVV